MKFKDRTAIITGGSRGIGKEIAGALLKEGANLVVSYRSNEEAAAIALEEFKTISPNVILCQADVTDLNQVKQMIKTAIAQFGKIDILINNAGIEISKLLMLSRPEDYRQVIETNLIGTINCCYCTLSNMVTHKFGRIINISSAAADRGNPGQSYYAASKAGINGFTRVIAKEYAKYGVTVNAVAPGFIKTEMTEGYESDFAAAIPLKRFGEPKEVAGLVSYLASDEAGYCTGQVYIVDGGLLA